MYASKHERYMLTSGLTILTAFISAILCPYMYDSGSRGFKAGLVSAACSLEIIWGLIGIAFFVGHWRSTRIKSRVLFAMNMCALSFIAVDTFRAIVRRFI
jgi:hypothetical protein